MLTFRHGRRQFSKTEQISTFSQLLSRESNVCLPFFAISRKRMPKDLLISIMTVTINHMKDTTRSWNWNSGCLAVITSCHYLLNYCAIKFNFDNAIKRLLKFIISILSILYYFWKQYSNFFFRNSDSKIKALKQYLSDRIAIIQARDVRSLLIGSTWSNVSEEQADQFLRKK